MTKTIRAYGTVSRAQEIERELQRFFDEEILIERGSPDEDQGSDAVWKSDLILFGFDPSAAAEQEALVNLVGRLIQKYGAWSYLPQVVLGLPEHDAVREALFRLGASCYLPAGLPPQQVARKVYSIWRATWWQTECQRQIPVLVVNRKGIIERANPFALQLFGPEPLVGQNYMAAIEGCPGRPLEEDHPISRTFVNPNPKEKRWGQTVCDERGFRRKGSDGQPDELDARFFLICNPLIVPSGTLHAAAVGMFDMSRWPRIIEAVTTFAGANKLTELYPLIVQQGHRFGFRRVLLYQFNSTDGRLYGRAAFGIDDPERLNEFLRCSFPAEKDPSSPIILNERRSACLFIRGAGQSSQFTEYLTGELKNFEDHERHGVTRWIEAPIALPTGGETTSPCLWGKLSFDQGQSSHQLDVRDAGDAAVFSSIVGHAIAIRQRLDQEEEQRRLIHAFSADLVMAIKPDKSILDAFVKRSLRLILDVTGGDIALYRRFDEQHPQTLRLIGEAEPNDPQLKAWLKNHVPPQLPESRVLSGYFLHFAKDKRWINITYVVPDPALAVNEFIREQGIKLGPSALEYLRFIQSEMHIPVFRGSHIVGVIIVIARRLNVFPPEMPSKVEQFIPAISLGIESARRHDDWLRMGQAVRRTSSLMQKLADIPLQDEDSFFAALATLLSAGHGLRWNRVFIFSCQVNKAPPHQAELVYALGGLAKDQAAHHRELQDAVWKEPRYHDLSQLVAERIKEPSPHLHDSDGTLLPIRDRLYDLCIEEPRRHGHPIRVDYAEHVEASRPSLHDGIDVDPANPIATLLRLGLMDLPATLDPLTLPIPGDSRLQNQWVLDMNMDYEDMFDETKRMFAFLLRGTADQSREPLGVVLVDMQSPYEVDEQDMIAATRIVLRTASDLLADRYQRRRNHGRINTLAARCHGPKLSEQWRKLLGSVQEVISLSEMIAAAQLRHDQIEEFAKQLTLRVLNRFKEDQAWSEQMIGDIQAFRERMDRLEGHDIAFQIEDLGALLKEWDHYYKGKAYKDVRIHITCGHGLDGLNVPCDPLVLRDAVGALIDNSSAESRRLGRPLDVHLNAVVVATPSRRAIPQVVELTYEDDGRGIDARELPFIMIDGFTMAEPPHNKGRGLAIISRQLLEYRGHLQCEEPRTDDQRKDDHKGVRFVIRLGVPAGPPAALKGQSHATTADRLG